MGRRKTPAAPPHPRHSPRHESDGDDDPFTPPRGSAPPAATEAPFDSSPATQESGREATLFSPEICMPAGARHIRRYSGATDEPMSRSSSQAQLPAAALVRCPSDARNPLQLSQSSPMIITDITPRNTSQSPAVLDSSPHTHRAASHSATPADGFVTSSSFREAHVKQMQRLLPSAAGEEHAADAILTWMTALHPLTPQSRNATTPMTFGVNPSFAKAEVPA
jgi:hypothetical protein